ncbi:unnamed protein product [Rotaria magnacalcarata]|uniref:OTU domain-containing protein n=1 Tax=Rotaria magnacalcarata TaxID=392030 RepID=A0A8S2N3L2_9BILA|nr:unnamed protein product [Rotaria magnacalcarata]
MQQYDVEQSDSTVKKGKLQSFNSIVPTAGNFGVNEYDYDTIEIDNLRNKHLISGNVLDNEQAAEKRQYQRSISMNPESQQSRIPNMQKRKSLQMAFQNDDEKSEEFPNNVSSFKDLEEYKSTQLYPTSNNTKNSISKSDQSEESKIKCNYHSSVSRLLEPTCEGIRSRIELLGELITSKKLDSIPDVYDEMAQIIASTERNERFMTGVDGKRLLELTTTAKSNLNIDLHNLDLEIQRQFGLYSVEVTGDGACAFRATLISGLQQPDLYQSELREKAIRHVLNDISYYSTVLRPGEKVSEQELKNWAYSMADSNTYGDEMANIAVADLYHIQLVIFRAGELLTVVNPRDGHVEHTAFLVNVGTHYKALVTVYELDEARRNSERISKHINTMDNDGNPPGEKFSVDVNTKNYDENNSTSVESDHNSMPTEDTTDLQSVILSDAIQTIYSSDNNDENVYRAQQVSVATTCSSDVEISQTIEFSSLINDHIDVSNTVQLLASGIGTELEKVSVKASTRKKKKKGTAYTIVIEEESTPCCFESLKNPALLKYKNQITEATAEDLELVRFIDKGNFGSVDHVRINNDSDFQIAVKRISLSTNEERACVTKAELTVMQDICTGHCPYLIEYYGAMIDTVSEDS